MPVGMRRSQLTGLAISVLSGLVLFSQGTLQSARVTKEGRMRLELNEIEPLARGLAGGPLSPIRVELETESKQSDLSAGLKFLVIFTNNGHETVELQDPDDAIQVELLDDRGWPIRIPTRPPAALINTREGPGPQKNAPRVLTMQPGEQHRVPIQIREVQTKERSQKVYLSRGTYTARVRVLLLAADPALERSRSYRKLESEQISIEFGR